MIKPVLKWVGGKSGILPQILPYFPKHDRYIEPFLGGGAVLFALLPDRAIVSDINPMTIELYQCLRDEPRSLIREVKEHEASHCKDYYYSVRSWDRQQSFNGRTKLARSARTLYLNRAGFNGLYRVNQRGQNNVPYGGDDRQIKVKREDLTLVSQFLRSSQVEIHCQDFGVTISQARSGDLIYCDPPYDATFTSYTDMGFTFDDRRRMFFDLMDAHRRGASFVISDSATDRNLELYRSYPWLEVHEILAPRSVSANGKGRGKVTELLIRSVDRAGNFPDAIGARG